MLGIEYLIPNLHTMFDKVLEERKKRLPKTYLLGATSIGFDVSTTNGPG